MPEIISLLSSPPNSPLRWSPRSRITSKYSSKEVRRKSFTEEAFHFSSDGLVLAEALDSPASKLGKRTLESPVNKAQPKIDSLLSDEDDFHMISSCNYKEEKSKGKESRPFDVLSDPIFTSSAPEGGPSRKKSRIEDVLDQSDDFELPENILDGILLPVPQLTVVPRSRAGLSERTVNLLANLGSQPEKTTKKTIAHNSNSQLSRPKTKVSAAIAEDIFSSSLEIPKQKQTAKAAKLTHDEKEALARERTKAKEATQAAREAEKERKRLEKEQKALEKQKAADIAEVNRAKTDKKASLTEMIIEMEKSFEDTSVANQVVEYMKQAEVECLFVDRGTDQSNLPHHLGKTITWKRKVAAVYSEDLGHWEPLAQQRIDKEPHVLVYLTAIEFATIAATSSTGMTTTDESTMKANLDTHLTTIRSRHPNSKSIYLIEGVTAWLKRNQAAKNRAYAAAVRSQPPPPSNTTSPPSSTQTIRPKKRKTRSLPIDLSFIDHSIIEEFLLHLQLHPSSPKIHLTATPHATATQVLSFTTHISTIPYRQFQLSHNLSNAAFCMTTGQIRTGEDAADVYVRMLQEIQRVTPSMAHGIASQYTSVRELVDGFKMQGALMLEDVKKSANKDGALSDRRLGQAVSRRLHKIFLGRDGGSCDV